MIERPSFPSLHRGFCVFWHRNGCLCKNSSQLGIGGEKMIRDGWVCLQGSQPVTSWTPPSWFAKEKGRGHACLLGFFLNRALNLCHQLLNSLVYCRTTCKETKFIFLSVNSDTRLGCVNFYFTSPELWMAAPVFTGGTGDKMCTSLYDLSLLLQGGLSKEARDGVLWC